jgi:hypothetical protein
MLPVVLYRTLNTIDRSVAIVKSKAEEKVLIA